VITLSSKEDFLEPYLDVTVFGRLHILAGVDPEYDQAVSDIQSTERELNDYLEKQKKILGCRVCQVPSCHLYIGL
jgi:hypothetical protein